MRKVIYLIIISFFVSCQDDDSTFIENNDDLTANLTTKITTPPCVVGGSISITTINEDDVQIDWDFTNAIYVDNIFKLYSSIEIRQYASSEFCINQIPTGLNWITSFVIPDILDNPIGSMILVSGQFDDISKKCFEWRVKHFAKYKDDTLPDDIGYCENFTNWTYYGL